MVGIRDGDPTEPLALARLACQLPTGGGDAGHDGEPELLAALDELLAHAQELMQVEAAGRFARWVPAMAAQIIAGTPRVDI